MRKVNTVKENQKLIFVYILGTIIIVFSMFFAFKQTAMGKEQRRIEELFAVVDAEEQLYVAQVRSELASQGFSNCGITMTKVATADGSFYYQVQINHRNLKNVEIDTKDIILNSLRELPNGIEEVLLENDSTIEVEFVYEII